MIPHDPASPTDAFVRGIDIHTLLPQQEPFVMVGALTHFDMRRTVTETILHEGSCLMEDGCLSAAGLLENVAQTCAARIGYINRFILHRGISAGVVGAMRNITIHHLPRPGDRLVTAIEVKQEALGLLLVTATIESNGATLLHGEVVVSQRL